MRLTQLTFLLVLLCVGCEQPARTSAPPLGPLVYTELPDITPEAAAVRERRIKRQLAAGAREDSWGALEEPEPLSPASSMVGLGERLVKALLTHNDSMWDQSFISASAYSSLVHVEPQEAAKFVDEIRGASEPLWQLFEPPPQSEMVNGGFEKVFRFKTVDMGSPRTLAGKPADDEEPGQYWNVVVSLEYRADPSLVLDLKIPKVVRIGGGLVVASRVSSTPRLHTLLRAGLHLKTELLRNNEFPFPFKVGNYWKFRRRFDVPAEQLDEMPMLDGSERLYEVTSVDLHGTMRVVTMDKSLNNSLLTKTSLVWLITPRQIVVCSRKCQRTLSDLNETLDYIALTKPIFAFPLEVRDGSSEISALEVPAGEFRNVVLLEDGGVKTFFAMGRGVIRRTYEEAGQPIIEDLVGLRLVP